MRFKPIKWLSRVANCLLAFVLVILFILLAMILNIVTIAMLGMDALHEIFCCGESNGDSDKVILRVGNLP